MITKEASMLFSLILSFKVYAYSRLFSKLLTSEIPLKKSLVALTSFSSIDYTFIKDGMIPSSKSLFSLLSS